MIGRHLPRFQKREKFGMERKGTEERTNNGELLHISPHFFSFVIKSDPSKNKLDLEIFASWLNNYVVRYIY